MWAGRSLLMGFRKKPMAPHVHYGKAGSIGDLQVVEDDSISLTVRD